jgi:hypothetical protein
MGTTTSSIKEAKGSTKTPKMGASTMARSHGRYANILV